MKLESIIKRDGGTKVLLDRTEYHFKPDSNFPTTPHLCDVNNKGHIRILLGIPEGYRPWLGVDDGDDDTTLDLDTDVDGVETKTTGVSLAPIELSDEDFDAGVAEAEADRAAFMEEMQAEAAANAAARAALDNQESDTFQAADFQENDPAEDEDTIDLFDDGEDGGEDADEAEEEVKATDLSTLSKDDLAQVYSATIGEEAPARLTKRDMIEAIEKAQSEA